MPWFFAISLAIVLLAVFIFHNSDDEISYLAASVSILVLLISLIAAPWQIKILLLSFALLYNKRLYPSNQPLGTSKTVPEIEIQPEPKTKLIYRGFSYEINSPKAEAIDDKNLGNPAQLWKYRQVGEFSTFPETELRYRGAVFVRQVPPISPVVEIKPQ